MGCTMIDMNSTSGFLGEVSCNTGGGPGQMNRLPPPCFNNLEPTESGFLGGGGGGSLEKQKKNGDVFDNIFF